MVLMAGYALTMHRASKPLQTLSLLPAAAWFAGEVGQSHRYETRILEF